MKRECFFGKCSFSAGIDVKTPSLFAGSNTVPRGKNSAQCHQLVRFETEIRSVEDTKPLRRLKH
jgi:hypothetical protein